MQEKSESHWGEEFLADGQNLYVFGVLGVCSG